jgi:hypothetical protein
MTEKQIEAVEDFWFQRVQMLKLKPGTKAYANAQQEFLAGAITTAEIFEPGSAAHPPMNWLVAIYRGEPIKSRSEINQSLKTKS